jgi:hypothetical protein
MLGKPRKEEYVNELAELASELDTAVTEIKGVTDGHPEGIAFDVRPALDRIHEVAAKLRERS